MKNIIITISLLFAIATNQALAQKSLYQKADFDALGMPFTTFLEKAEAESNVRFFYKNIWINSINVPVPTEGKSFKWIIDRSIAGYGLTYIVFQDNNIIFIPSNFTNDQSELTEGMVGYVKVIGNLMEKGKYKTNKVEGIVRAGKTEEPIVGAVVQDKARGLATTTDLDGHYELMLPAGQTELEISFIGLETEYVKVDVLSPGKLDVELLEASIALEGVTVTATGGKNQVNRTQMGVEAIDMQTMKKLPVLMGEADIVRSMTLMPGVQTMGEMSSGFNVRGGNVDQNLILLNEAPVYNTSHMFGLFSAFLPNAISNVDLFKGSQPANFGNRVASVMDITMKKADAKKFKGSAGIGVLNSQLFIETPVIKDICSLYIGGRTTYSNWILQKMHNANIKNSTTNFCDLIAKIDFNISTKHKLDIFGYYSNDKFNYNNINKFDYTSKILGLNYRWVFVPQMQFKLSASYSDYESNMADIKQESLGNNVETGITHLRSKAEVIVDFLNHDFILGFEANHLNINPGKQTPYNNESLIITSELDNEKGLEFAGFISDNYTLSDKISLQVGLRYSLFSKTGKCTQYVYDENQPRTQAHLSDTMFYSQGDMVKPYHGFEPRLGLRYKLNDISSLKLSYSYTKQYQQLISGHTSAMPSDFWKMADRNIKPLTCQQMSIGYFTTVSEEKFDVSAEFYYKSADNPIDYKNGAELSMNKTLEQDLLAGAARSYGFELMLKKNKGNFTGWISYTLSNTQMKVDGKFDDEKINNGKYYYANTHHLHDLSITANYQITRRWNASANFILTSGRPATFPEYRYSMNEMSVVRFSERNKYRLPAYHRLDLSITYDACLNVKNKLHPSLTFALYNAYGHKNVYSVFYKKDVPSKQNQYHTYGLYKLSIIGVPIPSLTLNIKF